MGGEVAAANPLPLATVGSGPRGEHAVVIDNGSLELEECFPLLWKASYLVFSMNNLQHHTHHKHHHFQIPHYHVRERERETEY